MNAKKVDKIAISTLYVIAGIIVTILAALILYILVRGIVAGTVFSKVRGFSMIS